MSFQQALSGLNAASRGLDVTGNNIANANTAGFKVSRPQFSDVFANSLGVNTGPAEPVEIEFDARVAPYVRARVWHPSQEIEDAGKGRVSVTMNVCHDWGLRSWILSWGPFARVVSPPRLAEEIRADLEAAGGQYVATS